MVRLSDVSQTPLTVAKGLAAQGLQVFPARYKDKMTLVEWKKFVGTNSHHMIDDWFKPGRGRVNFWVMTGRQSGYVVVDADSAEGDAWWREQLGDEIFDTTATSHSAKGTHYWFKIPEGWDKEIPSWAVHPKPKDEHNISFDFKADRGGLIVPPSIHESGVQYTWGEVALADAVEAPLAMLDGTIRKNRPRTIGDAEDGAVGTGGQTRSLLSRLLAQPPGAEGSGRNDWLARVAGHYAKIHHNEQDLYETQCHIANNMMGEPLDEAEFTKTIESIWRGEHERNQHRAIDAGCGYLVSNGTSIACQVRVREGEATDYRFVEYADFDLRAKGVMTDEAGRRTYWCEIVRASRVDVHQTERIDIVLRAEVLGDDRAFRRYLAGYACTIVPPDNMFPKAGSPGVRVQRYLESQQPPHMEIVPCLGWHPEALGPGKGGYVVHDGAITADGLHGMGDVAVRADPRLKAGGTAPHHYGFRDSLEVARDVLADVLTFHDEYVCSVFGAWWAACLLKPQIEERTSLFPFMAIEAPSESGKTNGFFSMMTQMNGNTRGETQPTKAALRDMAASHRNGIVWVDDLDDPAYLMELLRAATSGGSLTKMGEDRESVKNTQIVSPIVISGEALGLGTQKALIDRAVILKAPSPTARRSFKDPERPQWDDVLEIMERYPDGLHDFAGWYIQDALSVQGETIEAVRKGRAGGSGRASDKVAVLRAGSRLLDYLLRHDGAWEGRGPHARRVEQWLSKHLTDEEGVAMVNNENALTLEVLPWALRKWKFPDKPSAGDGDKMDTPVFIKGWDPDKDGVGLWDNQEIVVGFNVALLAEAWMHEHHGRNEKRTTTEEALRDQAMALGWKSKRQKFANGGGRLAYFFKADGDIARAVVRRALGG